MQKSLPIFNELESDTHNVLLVCVLVSLLVWVSVGTDERTGKWQIGIILFGEIAAEGRLVFSVYKRLLTL